MRRENKGGDINPSSGFLQFPEYPRAKHISSIVSGIDDEFHFQHVSGQFGFAAGAGRSVSGRNPIVPDFIQTGKVLHIRQPVCHPKHVFPRRTGFFQQSVDVLKAGADLILNCVPFGNLSGQVHNTVVLDDLGRAFASFNAFNYLASFFDGPWNAGFANVVHGHRFQIKANVN